MRTIRFNMVFLLSLITSLCLMLCACQMDNPEIVTPEHASQSEEFDVLSAEKALELVRINIGHEDTYIPLQQNISGDSAVIGDVYSVDILGDQIAVILLYNYNYSKEELYSEWFFFHLESYFIDDMENGAWHTSSLNDFAVDKNTGEVVARLALDGTPSMVPNSPYWNEAIDAAS